MQSMYKETCVTVSGVMCSNTALELNLDAIKIACETLQFPGDSIDVSQRIPQLVQVFVL